MVYGIFLFASHREYRQRRGRNLVEDVCDQVRIEMPSWFRPAPKRVYVAEFIKRVMRRFGLKTAGDWDRLVRVACDRIGADQAKSALLIYPRRAHWAIAEDKGFEVPRIPIFRTDVFIEKKRKRLANLHEIRKKRLAMQAEKDAKQSRRRWREIDAMRANVSEIEKLTKQLRKTIREQYNVENSQHACKGT